MSKFLVLRDIALEQIELDLLFDFLQLLDMYSKKSNPSHSEIPNYYTGDPGHSYSGIDNCS
jgi:hypothetical protein